MSKGKDSGTMMFAGIRLIVLYSAILGIAWGLELGFSPSALPIDAPAADSAPPTERVEWRASCSWLAWCPKEDKAPPITL